MSHHLPKSSFTTGLVTTLPIALGYFPIAFSFGVAATRAGLSGPEAFGLSLIIYAGAAQFLALALITGGAPVLRAVDSVGGRASDELMDLVAENGRLVSFGALSGRPLQVSAENLLFTRATISGFWGAKPDTKMTGAELGAARADLIRRAYAAAPRVIRVA